MNDATTTTESSQQLSAEHRAYVVRLHQNIRDGNIYLIDEVEILVPESASCGRASVRPITNYFHR